MLKTPELPVDAPTTSPPSETPLVLRPPTVALDLVSFDESSTTENGSLMDATGSPARECNFEFVFHDRLGRGQGAVLYLMCILQCVHGAGQREVEQHAHGFFLVFFFLFL